MNKRIGKLYILSLILILLSSIVLDQVTKYHAQETLMVHSDDTDHRIYQGRRYPVGSLGELDYSTDKNFLYFGFNYVRNPGAAWGMLSTLDERIRVPFFHIVTFIAIIVLGMYFRSTEATHRSLRFALTLILSGALGNFFDRLQHGFVIDWIDVRWRILGFAYDFPNFNVADSMISVGAVFLLYDMIFLEPKRKSTTQS